MLGWVGVQLHVWGQELSGSEVECGQGSEVECGLAEACRIARRLFDSTDRNSNGTIEVCRDAARTW